jgi:tRNA-dihydrouridine synthase B
MTLSLSPLHVGPYTIQHPILLAPMAGITDLPFRELCKNMGAGLAFSEMMTANQALWHTKKSLSRARHDDETGVIAVQIAGTNPYTLAEAAKMCVANGAMMIDINMGCPAKKVCDVAAGSALLRTPKLVADILNAVVNAVDVPVTLKTRTGWSPDERNAVAIARMAEDAGIQMLSLHGRTRQDFYKGDAEYDTIAAVKTAIKIPLIANGDITTPEKAAAVLAYTKADGVMIGRGAQGNPFIFQAMQAYFSGIAYTPPSLTQHLAMLQQHLTAHYAFYGEYSGCRMARKHIAWWTQSLPNSAAFRQAMYGEETCESQYQSVLHYFEQLINHKPSSTDSAYSF